jgi:hypothetical protein
MQLASKIKEFTLSLPTSKMSTNKNLILLFFFHSSIALLLGQRGAQDTWYLDREVELPKEMPGFRIPLGITIDSKGHSYVVDRGNNTITIWDQQGNFIKRIGGSGSKQGQFNEPTDIAITEEEIYIADKNNHRIQVLDLNGTFLREWGNHGSDNDKFNQPYSIALDMNGTIVNEVYIADRYNYKAKVFDANGTFLRTIGENIISESTGLSIGPDGLLYLSSCRSNKIEVFETNGTRVRSFSTSQNPFHIDFFGDKLAVAMGDNHKIEIFDKNGTSLSSFGSHGTNPNVFDEFYHPYGLTYDPSGNLHIADSHNNRIQVFDANNSYLRSYGIYGEATGVSPYGLHVTPENTFLLTDTQYHRVLEIDENGTFLQMIATYGSADGQVVNPRSVFLANDNRIYVADTSQHRIQIFERNGTFVRKFGTSGSADGQFNQPYGVVVSDDLEIFVVERYNHRVQVFDSNGTFLRKFGSSGTLEGQMNQPHDIAFSDQGNVMVADFYNRRVVHFSKAGEFIKHDSFNNHPETISNLRHGLTAVTRGSQMFILDDDGDVIKSWSRPGQTAIHDVLADGTIVWVNYNYSKIEFYKPTYRTVRPPLSKEVPLPEVISVVQPNNTNHLEVTYRINDADSSFVNAKMLGFIDGGNDLSQVIVPKTFVGAIAGKLDDNVSTNQTHTVTWNVGADWSVGFGELEVAILAKDDRDLLNIHFLTLPANSTNSAELQISRSPLTDTDLLNVWYWLLATGDTGIEHSIELSSINKPVAESNSTSLFNPQSISSLLLWLDANDTQSITHTDNIISQWSDKSGNDRHALFESGSPKINSTGGPSGMPYIEFRRDNGEDYLKVSGDPFMAKHMFYVFRSPHEKWNNYGGVLGHQSGRSSNYLFESNNYTFHSNRNPFAVSINGMDLYSSDGFNMKPLTNFMIMEIVVDNADESPKTNYKVGRNDGMSMDFDVVEILAFNQELSAQREDVLNYLSQKTNIPIVGLALAKESTTTGVGRGYLFDKMNLREATLEERTRAREGAISGAVNQFTPSFKVGPDERPNKVNEYGFDTGSTNGYWVTPK